ncbi:MAG: GNAT family N-acetyltransferase [Gammaproteobacteria bacterium]|nr:GNAT family N-acetyltransferase [Gammaproteobacteria bacterium]
MNIELRQMNFLDIQNYLQHSIREYAQAMFDLGEYPNLATAMRASESEVMAYYNQSLAEDTHHAYHIVDKSSNEIAGILAYSFLWMKTHHIAFVDYIEIYSKFRRKGFAKQAMKLMENAVRKAKISTIDLNVMMNKSGARKLYEGLGYSVTQGRKFGQSPVICRYDMRKVL